MMDSNTLIPEYASTSTAKSSVTRFSRLAAASISFALLPLLATIAFIALVFFGQRDAQHSDGWGRFGIFIGLLMAAAIAVIGGTISAVFSLCFGAAALSAIQNNPLTLRGRGTAKTAMLISVIWLLFAWSSVAILRVYIASTAAPAPTAAAYPPPSPAELKSRQTDQFLGAINLRTLSIGKPIPADNLNDLKKSLEDKLGITPWVPTTLGNGWHFESAVISSSNRLPAALLTFKKAKKTSDDLGGALWVVNIAGHSKLADDYPQFESDRRPVSAFSTPGAYYCIVGGGDVSLVQLNILRDHFKSQLRDATTTKSTATNPSSSTQP